MPDVVEGHKASGRRRWPMVTGAVALALLAGGAAYLYIDDDPKSTFCYSSGFLLPNGGIAGSGAN